MKKDIATRLRTISVEAVKRQAHTLALARIDPDTFSKVVCEAVLRNPDIANANELSLVRAISLASRDGLVPDGEQSCFIVGKDKNVTYMPMKTGLCKLIYESLGADIQTGHIRDGDKVTLKQITGDDDVIEVVKDILAKERGELIGAYAWAKVPGHPAVSVILDRHDIKTAKAMSKVQHGPWQKWEGQMAEKSAVKSLMNRLKYMVKADPDGRRLMTALDKDPEHYSEPIDITDEVNSQPEVLPGPKTAPKPKTRNNEGRPVEDTGQTAAPVQETQTAPVKKAAPVPERQSSPNVQTMGSEPPTHVTEEIPAQGEVEFELPDGIDTSDPTSF